jgi:hypothetical protein
MSTVKVLHTLTVRLANDKVVVAEVISTSFGRNASTIVDLRVKVTGHEPMIELVGSIEHSSHPDYSHIMYPAGKVKGLGFGPTRGDLNDVRAAAISAGSFRIGALAQEITMRVK